MTKEDVMHEYRKAEQREKAGEVGCIDNLIEKVLAEVGLPSGIMLMLPPDYKVVNP